MKRVEATIRPFKLFDATQELWGLGVTGVTSSDVQACERHAGVEPAVDFLPMSKLEIVAPDQLVERVIEVIRRITKTGQMDDGTILVEHVELAIRVRTGERGEQAL